MTTQGAIRHDAPDQIQQEQQRRQLGGADDERKHRHGVRRDKHHGRQQHQYRSTDEYDAHYYVAA